MNYLNFNDFILFFVKICIIYNLTSQNLNSQFDNYMPKKIILELHNYIKNRTNNLTKLPFHIELLPLI